MSKGFSGLFSGTIGFLKQCKPEESQPSKIEDIIKQRTQGLDLREHPRRKSLTLKQRKEIAEKIKKGTATREEYKQYDSCNRFNQRRQTGVKEFWKQEKRRIKNGEQTTREWTKQEKKKILSGGRPKVNGKTMHGHHTFSANKYPHLANRGEIIYPVTFDEHLYGWHGGNFKNSLPGKPINDKYNKL